MLLAFVLVYLAATLLTGLLASRLVKTTNDFMLAGQRLPFFMATATVFATWFGSETVLGASAQFSEKGLLGVIEDPFGASLCLLLVGLFFARPLYRLRLRTFGDFYRQQFGKRAEALAACCLIISYPGWIAAQFVALGFVVHLISGLPIEGAIVLASLVVVAYTFFGGMWAVSVTDWVQIVFIIVGLLAATHQVLGQVGGLPQVLSRTPDGFFRLLPPAGTRPWLEYAAAWITLGLGSVPQQDVYQRVMASRSEKVAVRSSVAAAFLYLTIAFLPLLLGLAATQILASKPADSQLLLPNLILQHTSVWVQVLFFGALLSAVMSTASGALLAPATILSENLLRPRFQVLTDKQLLRLTQLSTLAVAAASLTMALLRRDIYELVGEASAISLVSLFVPLVMGLFLKSRHETAALLAMLCGLLAWFFAARFAPGIPELLTGLAVSVAAYAFGLFLPKRLWPK